VVKIYSTDKIEKFLVYLKDEMAKIHLNPILANMYLYAMLNAKNDNNVILRPKWTFAIPEFNKYLNFYKKFNLLHWNGSATKFVPDEDLYQSYDISVNVEDKDTVKYILQIGKEISDFQNYYTKTIA
jgi:hypothetical protein